MKTRRSLSLPGLVDGDQRSAKLAAALGRDEQVRCTVALGKTSVDQQGVEVAMIEPTDVPAAFEYALTPCRTF